MSFKEHSIIKANWDKWENTQGFRFYHDDDKKWNFDYVPAWFIFDWCSIPICLFWQKIEPKTLTSCCYHDWLFRDKPYWFFRSNYLFLVAMRVDWVPTRKKLRYYMWVNMFWWITRFITGKTSKLNTFIDKYIP